MFRTTAALLIVCMCIALPTLYARAQEAAGQNSPTQTQQSLTKEQEAELGEAKKLYEEAEKLQKQNDYDGAIERVERALPIMERVLGEDHPYVIVSLNNLAGMYQAKNNYPAAERLFKRVLVIREKKFGPEHPDVAETLTDLGGLNREKGEYATAEPLLRRALDIREKFPGDKSQSLAAALNNLALLYKEMGQYERAEALYRRSLKLITEKLGVESANVTHVLMNLAALYRELGDYARAEQLNLRALSIREKALGPNHVTVATVVNNLGYLYREEGDYVKAEQMYLRALHIRESALRPDQPVIATSLNNLASLYHEKGDFERAEQMYRRALAIRERAYGPLHPTVASTQSALARLLRDRGDYDAAESLLQHALDIDERALGTNHPSVASVLDNLAVIDERRGNYAEAKARLERSLGIRILKFGDGHRTVVQSLVRLGNLAVERGEYARAESFLRRAIVTGKKSLGPTHPLVATALSDMSILYQARGDAARALPFQEESDKIREQRLSLILTTGSEQQRRLYMETLAGQTSIAISLSAVLAPSDAAAARHALTTLLQRKGRVLDVLAGDIGELRRQLDTEGTALLNQLTAAQAALAALTTGGDARGPEQTQLEVKIERLEAQISERAARPGAGRSPVSLNDVQRAIPEGAALVEIARYWQYDPRGGAGPLAWKDEHYVAYVVRKQGQPTFVDLGLAREIDDRVYRLRASLRDPRRADVREVAAATEAKVVRPIRGLLRNTRHVFIAPDSTLNLLPFGALADERRRYLLERYSFTYLTSGRDLLRLRERMQSRQPPIVIANPLFDLPQAASASDGAPSGSGRRFEPLKGTAGEAAVLGRLLGVKPLTGAQARESLLKQAHGPSILHIATHGFFGPAQRRDTAAADVLEQLQDLTRPPIFDPGENLLLRSGLALYGANDRRDGEGGDGILTALEASGLDLSGTKLVVLSACETGVGNVLNGEGVYGLRRALVLAGAESHVISLWKADDEMTKNLMMAYYRKLRQGQGRTEALRLAQLEVLRDRKHAHPYYWACFIPSGDWKGVGVTELNGQ